MLIIDHIIDICGFSEDSIMAEFIKQQGWTELLDVATSSLEEFADFQTVKDDGSYKAKPLAHHVQKFKGFLLFYNCQCQVLSTTLDEVDVLDITKTKLNDYLGSPKYHADLQSGFVSSSLAVVDEITPQELRCAVRHDM
jgi:hypothetical protein